MNNYVKKNELIQLLERGTEIDEVVFESVSGEEFAVSNQPIEVVGLREPFNLLIPKATWTKKDYIVTYNELSLIGTEVDKEGQGQLLIKIKDIDDINFVTTSDAVSQLFAIVNMSAYAKFLLDQPSKHFQLLLENYEYWFKNELAKEKVMVRTVVENGKWIIRCFASPMYQQVDNHVLLYCTAWALDKLKFNFTLTAQKIQHSHMRLNFVSEDVFELPSVGTLSYGFSVINSEAKTHTVEFLPTCLIKNEDGTSVPIILDKVISIRHYGKDIAKILPKILELGKLPEHVEQAIGVITLLKTQKVDRLLAYKIRSELIKVVGIKAFRKSEEKYNKVLTNNTYNLMQFFGRLNEIPVENEDRRLDLESMFWSVMQEQ